MRRRGSILALIAGCLLAAPAPAQVDDGLDLVLLAATPPEQFMVRGGRAAAHPYLADPGLDTPGAADIAFTGEEKSRGFVVFAKPPTALVKPGDLPGRADRCGQLVIRDCAGQYGPISFAAFALDACELAISISPLRAGNDRIDPVNFDIRAVRYCKITYKGKAETVPLLLERFDRQVISPRRLQQFWITYSIPPDTMPGTYFGQILIQNRGREAMALPVQLHVYPFRLVEPGGSFRIYYNHSPDGGADALRRELIDQRCHGMNTTTLSPPVTQNGELQAEKMGLLLDLCREAGFSHPIHVGLWNRITSEWLNSPDKSIGMWGPWFRYYPFSEKLDARYVAAVKTIRDEARRRGVEIVLAVADESGSHAWTTEATQHYNDLIKRELPDVVRELSVGGGWAMNRPEHELWKGRINVWTTNRWLPEKLELVHRDDPLAKIQLYNMAGGGSSPGGIEPARVLYGFFAWKAKAAGVAQWTYYHDSTPEDNYTWPDENRLQGRVPTLRWEAVREGVKDYRYLATLERQLAGRSGRVAEEARRLLAEIESTIELRTDAYDPITGGRIPVPPAGTCDRWRDGIAELIVRLRSE